MNQEVKAKWVAALRSGKYAQTKGRLHAVEKHWNELTGQYSPPGFCCLGVLCDLYAKEHDIEWRDSTAGPAFKTLLGSIGVPPLEVNVWAGLADKRDSLLPKLRIDKNREEALPALNDRYNFTFDQIADLIEEQF